MLNSTCVMNFCAERKYLVLDGGGVLGGGDGDGDLGRRSESVHLFICLSSAFTLSISASMELVMMEMRHFLDNIISLFLDTKLNFLWFQPAPSGVSGSGLGRA